VTIRIVYPSVGLLLLGTFGWAWLLWGYWVVAMPPSGLQITPAFIVCAVLGGFAPSLTAIVVTMRSGGRAAVAELLRPLTQWRLEPGLYAVALLLVPATAIASSLLQATFVGELRWPDAALLIMAFIWPLLAALGEEIGWRGVLLPRLERSIGLLPAAIIVGLLWGLWHLPADYIALKGFGGWFWWAFIINGPLILSAHSIIMSWLWRRTQGSLLAAVLYHWSITTSAMIAPTASAEGMQGLLPGAIWAAVMWLAATILLVFRRNDFR
jgi:uncharacterized protein